jgi:hypothetical protein
MLLPNISRIMCCDDGDGVFDARTIVIGDARGWARPAFGDMQKISNEGCPFALLRNEPPTSYVVTGHIVATSRF